MQKKNKMEMKINKIIFMIMFFVVFSSFVSATTTELILFKDECNSGTPSDMGWSANVAYSGGECIVSTFDQYNNNATISLINSSIDWTLSARVKMTSQGSTNFQGFGLSTSAGFNTFPKGYLAVAGNNCPGQWAWNPVVRECFGTRDTDYHIWEIKYYTNDTNDLYIYKDGNLELHTTTGFNGTGISRITFLDDSSPYDIVADWFNLTYTVDIDIYPISRVKIINKWNSSIIEGVNVTLSNGLSNLTQSDGIAYFNNVSGNYSFNATNNDYFTITGTTIENQTVTYEMYQSVINLTVTELFTGNLISNFSINLTGYGIVLNTSGSSGLIYPNVGNYTGTVIDNTGDDDFHTTNTTFEVLALDNYTHTFRIHQHYLNITVKNLLTDSVINNFTVNISSLNVTDNRQYTTTTGYYAIPVLHNTYNVIIVSAQGYAIYDDEGDYYANNGSITITGDLDYTFYLYTTNSVNINFYDSDDNTILDNITINIEFIGTTSINRSISNGTLYVDLLNPSSYSLIYTATGYRQGSYIFTLLNKSNTQLSLFLDKTNSTSLALITVKDKFSKDPIKNAEVTIQRYISNNWITEQILSTDFNGQTEGWFVVSTEFYNFLIKVDGVTYFGVINSNENKKTIYAEDIANGIIIEIDTSGVSEVLSYQNTYSVSTSLNFYNTSNSTGYFILTFDNSDNSNVNAQLEVLSNNDIKCSQTLISESGTIQCNVNVTSTNGLIYFIATGYINNFPVELSIGVLGVDQIFKFNWRLTGYLIAIMSVIIGFTLFLSAPKISILIGTGVFSIMILLNIILGETPAMIVVLIMFMAFGLTKIPRKEGQ